MSCTQDVPSRGVKLVVSKSATQRQQLSEQRHKVDFDTYDVTADELIRRVERNRIEIAPVYQRQFRWDEARQSRLIESIMLGIPVPPLFMATNLLADQQAQWEVVDGLQRLMTLVNFAGSEIARKVALLDTNPLILTGLEKLTELNGTSFDELPADIKTSFEDRPLKVIVLNDKSNLQVRFDLFERLNTGGIKLTDQEVRECVYRGDFMDFIVDCAKSTSFTSILKLPDSRWKDGTPEDYVLRFFAFYDNYLDFNHSVKEFLNNFAESSLKDSNIDERRLIFNTTFNYLISIFKDGIKTRKGMTPVNLFEAITVGAALALKTNGNLSAPSDLDWVSSKDLRSLTTGPTNSKPRVKGRIEFCRDKFLGL